MINFEEIIADSSDNQKLAFVYTACPANGGPAGAKLRGRFRQHKAVGRDSFKNFV